MRLSTRTNKRIKEKFLANMGMSEDKYVELLKGDFAHGARLCYAKAMEEALSSGKTCISNVNSSFWEILWYHKRNFRAVLSLDGLELSVPESGFDTTVLNKLDKDLEIDTLLGDTECYICLSHRKKPVKINGLECFWSVRVYSANGSHLLFHFADSVKMRKVYLSHCAYAEEGKCDRCGKIGGQHNEKLFRRSLFGDCPGNPESRNYLLTVLFVILYVADKYINREKAVRKERTDNVPEDDGRIMVIRGDDERDVARLIPMREYVYTYRESKPHVYKGGHHASPVSHTRNGYYRKCKHGNYVLRNGEFVKVERGLGNFIHVRSTVVNAHKDTTVADIV